MKGRLRPDQRARPLGAVAQGGTSPVPRPRGMGAWGLINAAALFRPVVAGITDHAAAAGQRQGNRTLSVPARRCARKPQRVNPQTRTASSRAGAGGERTHNVRHYATLGRCPERESASVEGQTGAPTRGLALPGRGGRIIEDVRFTENRNGRAELSRRYHGVPTRRGRDDLRAVASAGAVGPEAAFLSSFRDIPRRRLMK